MMPLKIVGVGRYLPARVVPNSEIEALMGIPVGVIDRTMAGVRERRWVKEETGSWMAAEASKEALVDAGLQPLDLDLIINASGTQEQAIPDGGPLIQRHLGLGASGVPCFSVHATCLSFLVGLHVAASFLATGRHRTILVACGDISSCGIDPKDHETFPLFGDAAAAVVVTRPPEGEPSAMEGFVFRTFGDGAYHTCIMGGGTRSHPNAPHTRPEDNYFSMNGHEVFGLAMRHGAAVLEELRPGLSTGLGDIAVVVPHQASGVALKALGTYGWDPARIARTLERLGNCVAASIPATLYEVVKQGRVSRGDRLLLVGTGAGLSISAAILRF
jgi:3-oxoacyl-[acyl-carrier-protein] synthase-3